MLFFKARILKNKISVTLEWGCPKLTNRSVVVYSQDPTKVKPYQFNNPSAEKKFLIRKHVLNTDFWLSVVGKEII